MLPTAWLMPIAGVVHMIPARSNRGSMSRAVQRRCTSDSMLPTARSMLSAGVAHMSFAGSNRSFLMRAVQRRRTSDSMLPTAWCAFTESFARVRLVPSERTSMLRIVNGVAYCRRHAADAVLMLVAGASSREVRTKRPSFNVEGSTAAVYSK